MNNNDLKELVVQDKNHIINFLLAHNLKVKNNQVTLLFSDGEVDGSTIDKQSFVDLWKLQYEPSLVKVEFIIEKPKELNSNITGILRQLLIRICSRRWPVDSYEPLDYSKSIEDEYNCYQKIEIDSKSVESVKSKVTLIGAIGYFN